MKISGHVVSTKPISLSRAAKLISRFAAVENGSSPAVALYLQRASDAFNHLLQSHDKRSKPKNLDSKSIETDKDSENLVRESSKKEIIDDRDAAEAPAKKKKKSGEARSDSKNMQTEKVSENLVRESNENEIINDGDAAEAPSAKKKKRKSGEASLDSKSIEADKESEKILVRESSEKEIINDGEAAEAPAKKKKKKKKRKSGESS